MAGRSVKPGKSRNAKPVERSREAPDGSPMPAKIPGKAYARELLRLQEELVKMAEWVREAGARVVVIFEGRDAAGKGGTIKRITEHLNPRIARIVALPVPTERQRTQWYFQRYVEELPAAGEIVLFDRSWYNRAGIEKVLGFCTPEEHREFLRQCPIFERLLVEDGIHLVKYWFSVSDEEQARRFEARIHDPMRRWKLSSTDLFSRTRWVDYSRAKDEMFVHTDIPEAPWFVVPADDKRRARLNCMAHLLTRVPYIPNGSRPSSSPSDRPTRGTFARRPASTPTSPTTPRRSGGDRRCSSAGREGDRGTRSKWEPVDGALAAARTPHGAAEAAVWVRPARFLTAGSFTAAVRVRVAGEPAGREASCSHG